MTGNELKRVAELAAIHLSIHLQTRKAKLEAEGKQNTWDYQSTLMETARMSVAIGIIQEIYAE